MKVTELREAFSMIKAGKEQELKDLNLVFFVKRKELVQKYNWIHEKYEQYKVDV